MNTVKRNATHGLSQFELSKKVLNNLKQWKLTPTAKLVLLFLADCYNPKKADMFPKQKTIAQQMGISERSVISAIQELHKEGLVISERKYTNRYKFTARILNLGGMVEDFSQPEEITEAKCKDCTLQSENFAHSYKEQEEEQEKNNKEDMEDFKILKDYAIAHGAKNTKAYIGTLKRNGSAEKIIKEFKSKQAIQRYNELIARETSEKIRLFEQEKQSTVPPTEEWLKLGEKLRKMRGL